MGSVLKTYLKSFGFYFLFYLVSMLIIAISLKVTGSGLNSSSEFLIEDIFSFVNPIVIFTFLSFANYKSGKLNGAKSLVGLLLWFILLIPITLYNYLGRVNSGYLSMVLLSVIILTLTSSVFVFFGIRRGKREEGSISEEHFAINS